MIIASGILTFTYVVFLLFLWIGWKKATGRKEPLASDEQLITVVVPVRNEEKNIKRLLKQILDQDYGSFEIICVDDHSDDETIKVLESLKDPRLRVMPNNGKGKKKALTTAVQHARGQIILTTDADCSIQKSWLSTINRYFVHPRIQLVMGSVVMMNGRKLFSHMQQIEFVSLVGASASTAAMRHPLMCNGANLGFRKEAFIRVDGYEGNFDIASGDDEFLMRKILGMYGDESVVFCAEKRSTVHTKSQPSLKAFVHQRIRWAGKWKHNRSAIALLVAFFILMVQVATIVSYVQFIQTGDLTWLSFILIRLIFDALILRSYCAFLDVNWRWFPFLLLFIAYPFYVVYIGLVSNFLNYSWKGRIYKV
jgi:poly-beta-1,6-N-acetyl-D-glucosamine synthase